MYRRHWAFAALLAVAASLYLAFTWQPGLASVGDDSASYLVLAQALAGHPSALAWVGYHTHFPPLFPALLALGGGAADVRVAHAIVAVCAALALIPIYIIVLREAGNRGAALALVAVFLACPTAWISAKGILSEPLFLLASAGAIAFFETRVAREGAGRLDWLVLGVILSAAALTRVTGTLLLPALIVHVGLKSFKSREWPPHALYLALAPPLAALLAWRWLRPVASSDSYQQVSGTLVESWLGDPVAMLSASARGMLGGWTASLLADPNVGVVAQAVTGLIAVFAAVGLILRLAQNRFDAWYVAASLCVLFAWVFREENTRRLLYPLFPFLLLYAGEALAAACRFAGRTGWTARAIAIGIAMALLTSAPAMLVGVRKALDGAPIVAGSAPRYSDMTEYFNTLDGTRSRGLAARHGVVLAGLEAIATVTPAKARIMWMRPEYVTLLGHRDASPWFYQWSPARVAQEVRDARIDYLVVARLFKSDLAGRSGDPYETLRDVASYSSPAVTIRNPVTGTDDFVLMKVEPARLEERLRRGG